MCTNLLLAVALEVLLLNASKPFISQPLCRKHISLIICTWPAANYICLSNHWNIQRIYTRLYEHMWLFPRYFQILCSSSKTNTATSFLRKRMAVRACFMGLTGNTNEARPMPIIQLALCWYDPTEEYQLRKRNVSGADMYVMFYLQHMICLPSFPSLFDTSASSNKANKKTTTWKD